MKCSKCEGTMLKGSKVTLGDAFACTRRDLDKLKALNLDKIQPYYCGNCGYIEFYKELKKKSKIPRS